MFYGEAKQMTALVGDVPAAGAGDFGEPTAVVHAFEQSADGGALASLFGVLTSSGFSACLGSGASGRIGRVRGVWRQGKEGVADVLVTETAGNAVASEDAAKARTSSFRAGLKPAKLRP